MNVYIDGGTESESFKKIQRNKLEVSALFELVYLSRHVAKRSFAVNQMMIVNVHSTKLHSVFVEQVQVCAGGTEFRSFVCSVMVLLAKRSFAVNQEMIGSTKLNKVCAGETPQEIQGYSTCLSVQPTCTVGLAKRSLVVNQKMIL